MEIHWPKYILVIIMWQSEMTELLFMGNRQTIGYVVGCITTDINVLMETTLKETARLEFVCIYWYVKKEVDQYTCVGRR